MARIVDAANLGALGWEKVIRARLLGLSHQTLEEWETGFAKTSKQWAGGPAGGKGEASDKPHPAPNVLVAALCSLPMEVVISQLSKEAWPTVKRKTLEPPSPLVWQWRARLCQLSGEAGLT